MKAPEKALKSVDSLALSIIKMAKSFWSKLKTKKGRRVALVNILLGILALGAICVGIILLWVVTLKIPDLHFFDNKVISQSTKIYDNTGKILLYDINQQVRRTVVTDDQLSQNLKNATISIEDKDFYKHGGIDVSAIIRSVLKDVTTLQFSQGGSTITQQVIKNALLTDKKSISRKIKEWILAIKLERQLNKDQILNLYLNETPYGGTIYGAEEASESFFGKPASDLTVAEAAYLAAIPQAPTYYSPFGLHRDALDTRKNIVLKNMRDYGYLTDDQYRAALAERPIFNTKISGGIKAPHFVMYIKQLLEEKYGDSLLTQGGLKVTTTLDYELQSKIESIGKEYGLKNAKTYNASNLAAVVIDPTNGQIRAMLGSRDYFDKDIEGNFNVALAHRQPGSSFKPIVYAESFIKGFTPDTVVFDVPTQFSTSCSPEGIPLSANASCYQPENYDAVFAGPISFRNALAQSKNIPSIKVLYLAGITDSINLAKKMGITSLSTANQYGLTLVLGGGEVSLLELTDAYGVFADAGSYNAPVGILKIEDSKGKVLEEFATSTVENVIPTQVAYQISDILSDNVARTPEFGAASPLYIPGHDVAVKTGTTNDYRDAWVIGYTPHAVLGVWAGNNDNSPMAKKISAYLIAPFWNQVMKEVLPKVPDETFPTPDPIDPNLKPVLRGIWQGQDGSIHDILHWVNKNNPNGPYPNDPASDSQYNLWEYGVQLWAAQYIASSTQNVSSSTPTTTIPSSF